MGGGVDAQQSDDGGVEEAEIADDLEHRGLLRAGTPGGADKLRRFAEFCAGAGGCDDGSGLTAANEGAGKGGCAWPCLDGQRLAGEHGLIEGDGPGDEMDVGGDDTAEGEVEKVAGDETGGGNAGPGTIPPHGGAEGETGAQGVEGGLSATFLDEGENGVEDQESGDDGCFEEFA